MDDVMEHVRHIVEEFTSYEFLEYGKVSSWGIIDDRFVINIIEKV